MNDFEDAPTKVYPVSHFHRLLEYAFRQGALDASMGFPSDEHAVAAGLKSAYLAGYKDGDSGRK